MLAAAAFAMENSTVPATAPADFQAGLFNGYNGADLRTAVNACFKPDQKMADDTDAFIAAIKAKEWSTVMGTIKGDEAMALDDADACVNDPQYVDVHDAYYLQQDQVEAAHADPDWQIKAGKALLPHRKEIKANMADAVAKWDSGDYYGAGQAIGKIDAIVFAPWEKNSFLQ